MALKSKERKEIEIPASSLADIAFLLMIFFMVTTMINTSKGLRFDLPSPENKAKTVQRHEVVIVRLATAGTITVDGREVARDGLAPALAGLKKGGTVNSMIFEVERGSPYGSFARVTSLIRLAGFPRFAIKGVD